MDFDLSDDQRGLIDGLTATLARFGDDYWLGCDREARFPDEFVAAMAAGGWLGIALPEEHGGAGLGVTEAALMMLEVAKAGGMSAASAIHMNIFGPQTIVKNGTPEQHARWLPRIVAGRTRMCFSVTEPDAGLDTTRLRTRAVRQGSRYTVNGRKIWCSAAQGAQKIMLLARTADHDPSDPTAGLSLFFTDLDRSAVEVRAIEKMGRAAIDSNELFIDNFNIPAEDRLGEEGKGFRYILQSLNPERILIGAEAVGIGLGALARATRYAKERTVFGRPIGMNQAIQHPLAAGWARLEAARLMVLRAATLYDSGQPCGVEANAGKWLAAETGLEACRQAIATHGGMGYAREFHVERLFREIMIPYLAPVSQQLALCYVAERGLGLPKSY
jgi:acyl-CoA dehydrogenase